MNCWNCKKVMSCNIKESTQVWKCPNCGWNIATSHFKDIYIDWREYSVYINDVHSITTEKIKLISKYANVNYVAAKKMLETQNMCVFKGKAPEVKLMTDELKKLNIQFTIDPIFEY